jgi:uncharacterized protein (TIGR03000 family)
MNRPSWKSLVFVVVIFAALVVTVDQANAWWSGYGGGAVYGYPAVSAWDGYCGSNLYLGCRPGPIRRLLFGPYRWYNAGCYTPYSCYRSYSCYPTYSYSCCGTVPTTSCCGDAIPGTPGMVPVPNQPTPAQKPVIEAPKAPDAPGIELPPDLNTPAVPNTVAPPAPGSTSTATPETSGVITVWVPFDAKVTINGMATKSTGSRRQFVSYDLKEGFSYKYEIKAEVVRDGKIVEDVKTAILTAGQNASLAFGFNLTPAEGLAAQ